ncbi:GCN5-related N-acetyltransferase [Actinobacteria bacterium OK074]|nr:GCN5-related N-acetyltransferase [Actinobacteria bacterium OK074]
MTDVHIRGLREEDYPVIIGRVDDWWGRPVTGMLPRLFLRHFYGTSFAAVDGAGDLVGFLVGFVSPSVPQEAHTHFIAVAPSTRKTGLGHTLYEHFFDLARKAGCRTVTAVVSPANTVSQCFHLDVGFRPRPLPGEPSAPDELPVWRDWDGPGGDRVRFEFTL